MAKSKAGKQKGYISKGSVKTVNKKTLNAMRSEYLVSPERLINQMAALKKGKDVWLTIDNPDKQQTNKRKIRVKVTAAEYRARFAPIKSKEPADAES